MSHNLVSLSQCLFNAFSWPDQYPPQADRQSWAIIEGYKRLKSPTSRIDIVMRANKEHTCVRGCSIKPGDMYFKYFYTTSETDYAKICAGCFAMILFFYGVEGLEPYMDTHWDDTAHQPVHIGKTGKNPGYNSPLDAFSNME
jgi:hypothetical protein